MADLPPIAGAIVNDDGRVIVCFAKCWSCMCGSHFDPPHWHEWADGEDVEHARATGQPDPSGQRCGCWCARTGGDQ